MPRVRIVSGKPQVCVKDHALWHQHPIAGPLMSELSEAQVESIYEGVRQDFWRDVAPDIAEEHGYERKLYSEGRSGSWLELSDHCHWIDYVVTDHLPPQAPPLYIPPATDEADKDTRAEYGLMISQRDTYLRFADAIEGAVKAAGEMFIQRLREAVADLERNREENTIRSVN